MPAALSSMSSQTTRLYISPFNPSLHDTLLNPAQRELAQNLSYHQIETFPERGYGYLDLSTEEAQKLRKRYNNAILKGTKMRVEEAKPRKQHKIDNEDSSPSSGKKRTSRQSQEGVLPGIELPSGRKVKRGWTSDVKAGKGAKGSEESRLVFRTGLPSNAASETSKSTMENGAGKPKKKGSKSSKLEVKEFSKTTKHPSFLRSDVPRGTKRTSEYVEGTGWVDEDGTVVEGETKRRRTRREPVPASRPPAVTDRENQNEEDSEPSSSEVSSESSEEDSSSDSDDSNNSDDPLLTANPSIEDETPTAAESASIIPNSSPSILITKPESSGEAKERVQHPLESVFKRPPPGSAKGKANIPPGSLSLIDTSFSFFDEDAGADDEASTFAVPQTPFTRRDLQTRGVRSAAPTPDTAAIGKRFMMPWKRRSTSVEDRAASLEATEDMAEDMEEEEGAAGIDDSLEGIAPAKDGKGAKRSKENQTEWEKHFWEHRGEYDRSWKTRRREVRKETRQAANRRSKK